MCAAQVQLKLELAALTEEVDFLRARETSINEEQNRLQMVAEMSKRLGTNVSKFELEALRNQVHDAEDCSHPMCACAPADNIKEAATPRCQPFGE